MALPAKTGTCSICRKKGSTDWHHIISQHHARKIGRADLLSNPDNVVELCRSCHDQTTASMVRKRLTKEKGPLPRRAKKKAPKKAVVNPKAQKEAIQLAKRKKKSFAALKRRGVFKRNGKTRTAVENHIKNSLKQKAKKIETLYPPDHWLHDAKLYNEHECKTFEGDGWRWDRKGGADNSQRRPSPHYRPPPPKGSKLN